MNFTVFTQRQLQDFQAFLQLCDNDRVTDIRIVRQRIGEEIHRRHMELRRERGLMSGNNQRPVGKKVRPKRCPSCGKGVLLPVINRDGLNIVGCKKCRYSEVVG
jgi:hypothetical protein